MTKEKAEWLRHQRSNRKLDKWFLDGSYAACEGEQWKIWSCVSSCGNFKIECPRSDSICHIYDCSTRCYQFQEFQATFCRYYKWNWWKKYKVIKMWLFYKTMYKIDYCPKTWLIKSIPDKCHILTFGNPPSFYPYTWEPHLNKKYRWKNIFRYLLPPTYPLKTT